jgi:hypothetical protein
MKTRTTKVLNDCLEWHSRDIFWSGCCLAACLAVCLAACLAVLVGCWLVGGGIINYIIFAVKRQNSYLYVTDIKY